jgi:hypothetical protein
MPMLSDYDAWKTRGPDMESDTQIECAGCGQWFPRHAMRQTDDWFCEDCDMIERLKDELRIESRARGAAEELLRAAVIRAEAAEKLLRDLVEAVDKGAVQMQSYTIVKEGDGYHHAWEWHDEWLHHARTGSKR